MEIGYLNFRTEIFLSTIGAVYRSFGSWFSGFVKNKELEGKFLLIKVKEETKQGFSVRKGFSTRKKGKE